MAEDLPTDTAQAALLSYRFSYLSGLRILYIVTVRGNQLISLSCLKEGSACRQLRICSEIEIRPLDPITTRDKRPGSPVRKAIFARPGVIVNRYSPFVHGLTMARLFYASLIDPFNC